MSQLNIKEMLFLHPSDGVVDPPTTGRDQKVVPVELVLTLVYILLGVAMIIFIVSILI